MTACLRPSSSKLCLGPVLVQVALVVVAASLTLYVQVFASAQSALCACFYLVRQTLVYTQCVLKHIHVPSLDKTPASTPKHVH